MKLEMFLPKRENQDFSLTFLPPGNVFSHGCQVMRKQSFNRIEVGKALERRKYTHVIYSQSLIANILEMPNIIYRNVLLRICLLYVQYSKTNIMKYNFHFKKLLRSFLNITVITLKKFQYLCFYIFANFDTLYHSVIRKYLKYLLVAAMDPIKFLLIV